MRVTSLFLLVASVALPVRAQEQRSDPPIRSVSVAQLEQVLARARGENDRQLAKDLATMELTERLSDVRWERWNAQMPGIRSQEALRVLADASAFLSIPSADIPNRPAPDLDAQRGITGKAADYVAKLPHFLPNLFATRMTLSFRNAPRELIAHPGKGMIAVWEPLKLVGRNATAVSYRDGAEVEASAAKWRWPDRHHPLVTTGEFGPILTLVLSGAAHGHLDWSHWEEDSSGVEAVFAYSVPREQSHYEPGYCCVGGLISSYRSACHGNIAVDPASGVVRWLTLETDLPLGIPLLWTGTMVRYAMVDLDGKLYPCPLRSVTITQSMPEAEINPFANALEPNSKDLYNQGPLQILLNDTAFTNYHLFHATVRILPVQ